MKIAQIDVFKVDLSYSGGVYVLSGGREYGSFDATIVRITTDTGIEEALAPPDTGSGRHIVVASRATG